MSDTVSTILAIAFVGGWLLLLARFPVVVAPLTFVAIAFLTVSSVESGDRTFRTWAAGIVGGLVATANLVIALRYPRYKDRAIIATLILGAVALAVCGTDRL